MKYYLKAGDFVSLPSVNLIWDGTTVQIDPDAEVDLSEMEWHEDGSGDIYAVELDENSRPYVEFTDEEWAELCESRAQAGQKPLDPTNPWALLKRNDVAINLPTIRNYNQFKVLQIGDVDIHGLRVVAHDEFGRPIVDSTQGFWLDCYCHAIQIPLDRDTVPADEPISQSALGDLCYTDPLGDDAVSICGGKSTVDTIGFHAAELPDGSWAIHSALDCESGHFVEDYSYEIVPAIELFDTAQGMVDAAYDWFIENQRLSGLSGRRNIKKWLKELATVSGKLDEYNRIYAPRTRRPADASS